MWGTTRAWGGEGWNREDLGLWAQPRCCGVSEVCFLSGEMFSKAHLVLRHEQLLEGKEGSLGQQ